MKGIPESQTQHNLKIKKMKIEKKYIYIYKSFKKVEQERSIFPSKERVFSEVFCIPKQPIWVVITIFKQSFKKIKNFEERGLENWSNL